MDAPSSDVVALFRSAPEAFTGGRDALSKALRAKGLDDEARAVKRLRKPTLLAWALNQLTDRDPAGIDALLDAGAELRAAQQAALSGTEPERLQGATATRRRAVVELRTVAAGVLTESGRDPIAHLDDIAAALEAAAVDPAAGVALRQGTLERPPRPSPGFGDLAGLRALPGGKDQPRRPAPIARTELQELRRRRDADFRRAKRERATADDLARQLAEASVRLERLRERDHDAQERAEGAELDARRAEHDLERAEKQGKRD